MTDTAIVPSQGSVVATGQAPGVGITVFPGCGTVEVVGKATTLDVHAMTVIAVPCGSILITSYPALLQRWTTTAAATTTWTNI